MTYGISFSVYLAFIAAASGWIEAAASNYDHIHNTLSEYSDVVVAHPKELTQIADTDKKTGAARTYVTNESA